MEVLGIVGAGIMGSDLAMFFAESGYRVILNDRDAYRLAAAREKIHDRLTGYERKGRLDAMRMAELESHVETRENLETFSEADIVIECVTEDLGIKKEVFVELDRICRPGVILASNTSSKSITAIAAATKRPESVIGLHFMNPVRAMRLVEIICGLATTRETFETVKQIVKKAGKEYVESRDYPGFIANRILMPMINEAIFALYEGAGTVEAIDKVMKLGMNQPMGPLELADMVGLDIVLAILDELYKGFGDTKYRPCPLLKKYVAAGYQGRKSGRGFYTY
ncbi:MAG: 3-hydroxyacyl-CoA dehydrogenase NAD-binding domain-containing protein [Spirochaetes bacterium]|jgi:3-hydroxybutyryl-CoA dehydrogenase|nr:3-hydroxyacyl-CoA dehydrogenase NAD-binding domain-containing protein [Spirochaetota bacterium]